MRKKITILATLVSVSILLTAQTGTNVLIDGITPSNTISRHIYGHFSEHLGRCIYDGFWVSDTSSIVKKDRIRLDIIDALKK